MADKFPALDEIDKNLPTTGDEAEDADFLAREKELVGNEFATEEDQQVLAESEDEFSEFKEQFPDVEGTTEEATHVSDDEFEGFGNGTSDSTNGKTTNGVDRSVPSSHLKDWQERRDLEISSREEANARKKETIVEKAQQTIDDFYDNYNNKKEQHLKEVLKEQEAHIEKRDGFLGQGTLWDRVNELIGEVGEGETDGSRDKTRFKGLLQKLKGKENAPGAGGYQ